MARRGDRVAPPPAHGGWDARFADKDAADGWDDLCKKFAGPTRTCWEKIVANPRTRSSRQHQLQGAELGTIERRGIVMEQWQYEIAGAARVWYAIEDESKILWLTLATVGHPKATE